MAQKIPLSNSTRFIYILHNESYYILRYLNCSPHLHVLPSSCEHKSFLILDKVASVTKVSSERIVTSSTMFLLLLLGSGLSLSNAVAAEPTAELTVYYEALCGDSIKFLFSFSPSLRTFNHLYIYNLDELIFSAPSFVTTQLTPAWEMFGEDLVINFKPFGKANVQNKTNLKTSFGTKYL